ncbi:hypothetical protein MLD38_013411 [Melastoma candidum]|uniref:Uncharacterized protein n=1 Tax=Melastoma candidum TaxID=119954 RepID=A0ACB9R9H6_9MYRT|nr:hypothetical protein MLD38_013411 [Melastoma candidum]
MGDMDLGELELGGNSPSDAAWLCSLTESELDFLVSLKTLVIQRAENMGVAFLAERFDLKMLRALGLLLMDHLQGNIRDLPDNPELAALASHLDACNLLKLNPKGYLNAVEIKTCLESKPQKGLRQRPSNAPDVTQKRRKKQSTLQKEQPSS